MGILSLVTVLVATVTIAVVLGQIQKPKEDETCSGKLQCLPTADCANVESDIHYDCGEDGLGRSKICCMPKTTTFTGSVDSRFKMDLFPDDCGAGNLANKIANGKNASLGQFPWMALLGYVTKKINIPQYLCGGTLINQRYVLTAAHCTVIKSMKLVTVRLGELNLESEIECEIDEGVEYCGDPPVDAVVEKVITHPNYNNGTLKNDIGLIRLAKNITEYTEFIRPICMPFTVKAEGKFLTSKTFLISGWGKTTSSSVGVSSVLQYTSVNGWDSNRCTKALPAKVRPINVTQICAAGKNLQEACRGDSGGPMTVDIADNSAQKTIQIGIVSFKSLNTCGTEDLPTVFTRVDQYLDWISDNMSP